jgi:glycosyltransferase involved in cell wall biosynthesis
MAALRICALIPALDEEGAIGHVVSDFLSVEAEVGGSLLEAVIVGDNASTDRTAEVATAAGAVVVPAPIRGYGSACLAGMAHLGARPEGPPDVVVFVDGDGSNRPEDLHDLLAPIVRGQADLVLGSRVARALPGSLTAPQRFGNGLASFMLRQMYGTETSDLGPFRAITWSALMGLKMQDPNYGWTVEMQVKAAKQGLRVAEVDVQNVSRIAGESKVAGTVRGVVGAGYKIIWTIVRYR